MTRTDDIAPKTRRRTCWHRWRYQHHQRKRRGDPAMSVAMQLLVLVLLIVGRPTPAPAPPRPVHRPPPRPDWSPEAEARERGDGGHILPPRRYAELGRYRTAPSYRRLVRDIKRPHKGAHADALDVLRRRLALPPEAAGWLDEIVRDEDWSALALHTRPGMTDSETEAALLRAALAWVETRTDTTGGSAPPPPSPDEPSGRKL